MKKIFLVLTLFFISLITFSFFQTSEYYKNDFQIKNENNTVLLLKSQIVENKEITDFIKKEIINNNYQVNYITNDNNIQIKYSTYLPTNQFHDYFGNINYEIKSFSDYKGFYFSGLAFEKNEDALKIKDQLIDRFKIDQEMINLDLKLQTSPNLIFIALKVLILGLLFIIILTKIYFINNNKNIVANYFIYGKTKKEVFLKLFKNILSFEIILIILYFFIIYFYQLKINYFEIITILIMFISSFLYFIYIKNSELLDYLKNKKKIKALIPITKIALSLILILLTIGSVNLPELINQVKTSYEKVMNAQSLKDVYGFPKYYLGDNLEYAYNLETLGQEIKKMYNDHENMFLVGIEEASSYSPEYIDYVVCDQRYAKKYIPNYNENKTTIMIEKESNDKIDRIIETLQIRKNKEDYNIIEYNKNDYKLNTFNSINEEKNNYQPEAIVIYAPQDLTNIIFGSSVGRFDGGMLIRFYENDPQKIINIENYLKINNLNDNFPEVKSIYENYKFEMKTQILFLIEFILLIILLLISFILTLYMVIDLIIKDKIKIITIKKFSGISTYKIYGNEIIMINLNILISIIISYFIINSINLYLILFFFIIINVINLLIIKRIENKKLLEMLKQE